MKGGERRANCPPPFAPADPTIYARLALAASLSRLLLQLLSHPPTVPTLTQTMLSRTLRVSARTASLSRAVSTSAPRLALSDIEALAGTKQWKGTHTDGKDTTLLSGGEYTTGATSQWIEVHDPSTQRVLTRVPETTHDDMVKIVDRAEQAFLEWKDASILKRQAVMLK